MSFAIYWKGNLLANNGRVWCPLSSISTIKDIWEAARTIRVKQVWFLAPDFCEFSALLQSMKEQSQTAADSLGCDLVHHFWTAKGCELRPEKPFSRNVVTVFKKGEFKSTVQIIFSGLDSEAWAFDSVSDPELLALSIGRFIQLIGVMPSFPVRTAQKLLSRLDSEPEPVDDFDLESYFASFADSRDRLLIYFRDLFPGEKRPQGLVGFDKKAMFLAASSGLRVGVGRAKFAAPGDDPFSGPGLWYVRGKRKPGASRIFDLFDLSDYESIYSPLLEVLKIGFDLEFQKGLVWEKSRRLFDPFYKVVSTAKIATQEKINEDRIVNSAVKSLYTDFFGFMRKPDLIKSDYLKKWYRPDFRGLIVSQALANLIRNVLSVEAQTGRLPVGCLIDCLIYPGTAADYSGTVLDSANFSLEYEISAAGVFDRFGKAKNTVNEINSKGKNK